MAHLVAEEASAARSLEVELILEKHGWLSVSLADQVLHRTEADGAPSVVGFAKVFDAAEAQFAAVLRSDGFVVHLPPARTQRVRGGGKEREQGVMYVCVCEREGGAPAPPPAPPSCSIGQRGRLQRPQEIPRERVTVHP